MSIINNNKKWHFKTLKIFTKKNIINPNSILQKKKNKILSSTGIKYRCQTLKPRKV